ncbi:MAG TPA: nickel-dependent hydrogenase large subunit, partial [Thermoplasmata archaeon]|nr:nickel-dependent hydrogenase large subunit [Thermoplasmata archaeon]
VGGQIRALRRLLYCGEWIESHPLHIYLLHAPDFLGYEDAIRMAKDYPDAVKNGLALKKVGNALMTLLGGREIHPINVRVGGFYRAPTVGELKEFRPQLETALKIAEETVRFAAGLDFPAVEEDYEFVSLRHEHEYPFNEGDLVSNKGLHVPQDHWEEVFEEVHMPYANALQSIRKGTGASYHVGPLARYANNRDHLTGRADAMARAVGLENVVRNPYKSIIVRAVETVYAVEEALRIIDAYERPQPSWIEPPPVTQTVTGGAVTEAPRGILYHRYRVGPGGLIEDARIVAPTSQNQKRIEDDLRHLVERSMSLDEAALTDACERAVRNYDPCISCATHFLKLDLERS